jgi:hypothetical protein
MADSILDKILSSKEDQEKEEFNPQETVAQLLRRLTSKEAEVLQRRFGLNDYSRQTLEVIGQYYQVTRERIRQIENLGIKKIKDIAEFHELMKPIERVLTKVLEEHGEIIEERYLVKELFFDSQAKADAQATLFILAELLDKKFAFVEENEEFKQGWRLKTAAVDFIRKIIAELIKIISQQNKPLKLEDLFDLFCQTDLYKNNQNKVDLKKIESYLKISQKIAANPFQEYGLSNWGSVLPRRMNDRIYLVLKKESRPMHFVEIAQRITQIFKKKAYPPTVHNELILNDYYVLVGRGIYALKEWGYQKGVVADVLVDILKKKNQSMTRQELLSEVLKQRMVKKNTVFLALTNKNKFKKLPDGKYTLAGCN